MHDRAWTRSGPMLQYEREFDRPRGWDEQARFETSRYVEGRHFRVRRCDHAGLSGERGDLLGNLTSFDMRRLQAYVQVSPVGETRVRVALAVNPRFQQITAWNGAF